VGRIAPSAVSSSQHRRPGPAQAGSTATSAVGQHHHRVRPRPSPAAPSRPGPGRSRVPLDITPGPSGSLHSEVNATTSSHPPRRAATAYRSAPGGAPLQQFPGRFGLTRPSSSAVASSPAGPRIASAFHGPGTGAAGPKSTCPNVPRLGPVALDSPSAGLAWQQRVRSRPANPDPAPRP